MNNSAIKSPLPSRTDILTAIVIGLLALALFIRTLAPSLLWGDSAEFQTLSYTLGVTHPTGYATQIVFGKIFTLIPIQSIAWRVNLMSAFFGALAVACTYLIVRLLGVSRVPALSAGMLLAFTEGFWWRALVAESYAPAAGMLALVWLFFMLWRNTGRPVFLFLAGLAGALSIGIHSTVVMTAASVLIVMAFTARKRAEWFSAAAGALLGAALFLGFFFFLDYNDPPSSTYNAVYRTNLSAIGLTAADYDTPLERFLHIFPAGSFWEYYFSAEAGEISRRLVEYGSLFPVWALVLIVIGAAALFFRNRWRDGLYPLIAFLLIWGFAVTVAFSVYREFYVPVTVITSVWFGVGAGELLIGWERLFRQDQPAVRTAALTTRGIVDAMRVILPALLIILPIWNARRDLTLAVRSGYTTFVREYHIYPVFAPDKAIRDARRIINRVEPNAILFADWDKLYSYIYTAHIEEGRLDLTFHEAWIGDEQVLSETTLEYIDANIDNRPIYFTVDMPGLTDYYQVTHINDTLYRIQRK